MLQPGATCCNLAQHAATWRNMLQPGATCCNLAQHAATWRNMLHCTDPGWCWCWVGFLLCADALHCVMHFGA
jgi:hypothetical protein